MLGRASFAVRSVILKVSVKTAVLLGLQRIRSPSWSKAARRQRMHFTRMKQALVLGCRRSHDIAL